MKEEDRKDFWSGASVDQHAEDVPASEGSGSFLKSLLIDIVIAVLLASFLFR